MARDSKEFGFWRAVGKMSVQSLFLRVEMGLALLFGGGGGVCACVFLSSDDRVAIAADFLTLAGALIGVVFGAFTLVVTLMSEHYVRWLGGEGGPGVKRFLQPFLVSIGIQLANLIVSVVYRAIGSYVVAPVEVCFFVLVSSIFVYARVDIIALGRTVLMHGVTRADAIEIQDLESRRDRLTKSDPPRRSP